MEKLKLRWTASLTLLCFLLTGLTPLPADEISLKTEVPSFSLSVPPELGTVEVLQSGRSGTPTVIHLQTAHGHYEAQKKIEQILEYLKKNNGIEILLLEGTSFSLNPELLQFFPSRPDLTREAAEALTQKAWLKGSELFLLNAQNIKAQGIENLEAYVSTGDLFREVLIQKEKSAAFLQELNLQIERLSSPYLSPELRSFLKSYEQFELHRLPFLDWISILKRKSAEHFRVKLDEPSRQLDWPMLYRLFKLRELEQKINLGNFGRERGEFLKKLPKAQFEQVHSLLSAPLSQHILPDPETGLLFENMISFLGENFDYSRFPNVARFIGHLILQSELKGGRLVREIDQLAEQISEKLAVTPESKELLELLANYRLLQKLFLLEVTPEEYARIVSGKDFRPSLFLPKFLSLNRDKRVRNSTFKGLNEIDLLFDEALDFYAGVKARDGYMLSNIDKILEKSGARTVAVITGGFHSEPFEKHFGSKQFNYARIAPKITAADDKGRKAYTDILLEKTGGFFLRESYESPFFISVASDQVRTETKGMAPAIDAVIEEELRIVESKGLLAQIDDLTQDSKANKNLGIAFESPRKDSKGRGGVLVRILNRLTGLDGALEIFLPFGEKKILRRIIIEEKAPTVAWSGMTSQMKPEPRVAPSVQPSRSEMRVIERRSDAFVEEFGPEGIETLHKERKVFEREEQKNVYRLTRPPFPFPIPPWNFAFFENVNYEGKRGLSVLENARRAFFRNRGFHLRIAGRKMSLPFPVLYAVWKIQYLLNSLLKLQISWIRPGDGGVPTLLGITGLWGAIKTTASQDYARWLAEDPELRALGAEIRIVRGDDWRSDKTTLTRAPQETREQFSAIQAAHRQSIEWIKDPQTRDRGLALQKKMQEDYRAFSEGMHRDGLRGYDLETGEVGQSLEEIFYFEGIGRFLLAMKGHENALQDPRARFRSIADSRSRGLHRIQLGSDGKIRYLLGLDFPLWAEIHESEDNGVQFVFRKSGQESPVPESQIFHQSELYNRGIILDPRMEIDPQGNRHYRIHFGYQTKFEEKSSLELILSQDRQTLTVQYEGEEMTPVLLAPEALGAPVLVRHDFNPNKIYVTESLLLPLLDKVDGSLRYLQTYDDLVYLAGNFWVRLNRVMRRAQKEEPGRVPTEESLRKVRDLRQLRHLLFEDPRVEKKRDAARILATTHNSAEALFRLWAYGFLPDPKLSSDLDQSLHDYIVQAVLKNSRTGMRHLVTTPEGLMTVGVNSELMIKFFNTPNAEGIYEMKPEARDFFEKRLLPAAGENFLPGVIADLSETGEVGIQFPEGIRNLRLGKVFIQVRGTRVGEFLQLVDREIGRLKGPGSSKRIGDYEELVENLLRESIESDLNLARNGFVNRHPERNMAQKVVFPLHGTAYPFHDSIVTLAEGKDAASLYDPEKYRSILSDPPLDSRYQIPARFRPVYERILKALPSLKDFQTKIFNQGGKRRPVSKLINWQIAAQQLHSLYRRETVSKFERLKDHFNALTSGSELQLDSAWKKLLAWTYLTKEIIPYRGSEAFQALDSVLNDLLSLRSYPDIFDDLPQLFHWLERFSEELLTEENPDYPEIQDPLSLDHDVIQSYFRLSREILSGTREKRSEVRTGEFIETFRKLNLNEMENIYVLRVIQQILLDKLAKKRKDDPFFAGPVRGQSKDARGILSRLRRDDLTDRQIHDILDQVFSKKRDAESGIPYYENLMNQLIREIEETEQSILFHPTPSGLLLIPNPNVLRSIRKPILSQSVKQLLSDKPLEQEAAARRIVSLIVLGLTEMALNRLDLLQRDIRKERSELEEEIKSAEGKELKDKRRALRIHKMNERYLGNFKEKLVLYDNLLRGRPEVRADAPRLQNVVVEGISPQMLDVVEGEIAVWEPEAKRINLSIVRPHDTPEVAHAKVENEIRALEKIWENVKAELSPVYSSEDLREADGLVEDTLRAVNLWEQRSEFVFDRTLKERPDLRETVRKIISDHLIPALENREELIYLDKAVGNLTPEAAAALIVDRQKELLMIKVFEVILNLPYGFNTTDENLAEQQRTIAFHRILSFYGDLMPIFLKGMSEKKTAREAIKPAIQLAQMGMNSIAKQIPEAEAKLNADPENKQLQVSVDMKRRLLAELEEQMGYIQSVGERFGTYDYVFEYDDPEDIKEGKVKGEIKKHEDIFGLALGYFPDASEILKQRSGEFDEFLRVEIQKGRTVEYAAAKFFYEQFKRNPVHYQTEREVIDFLMRYYDLALHGETKEIPDKNLIALTKTMENESDNNELFSTLRGHGEIVSILSPPRGKKEFRLGHWVDFNKKRGIVTLPFLNLEKAGLKFSDIRPGDYAIVDGKRGIVTINPSPPVLEENRKRGRIYKYLNQFYQKRARLPAKIGGHEISFWYDETNLNAFKEVRNPDGEWASRVTRIGGRGVGLLRLEELMRAETDRQGIELDEWRLGLAISEILSYDFFVRGRPLVVRLFDVAPDKRPSFLTKGDWDLGEIMENRTGVRFYLSQEEKYRELREFGKRQLRALFAAHLHRGASNKSLRILFSDVRTAEEVYQIEELIEEAKVEFVQAAYVDDDLRNSLSVSVRRIPPAVDEIPIGYLIEHTHTAREKREDLLAAILEVGRKKSGLRTVGIGSGDLMKSIIKERLKGEASVTALNSDFIRDIYSFTKSAHVKGIEISLDGTWANSLPTFWVLMVLKIYEGLDITAVPGTHRIPELMEFARNLETEDLETGVRQLRDPDSKEKSESFAELVLRAAYGENPPLSKEIEDAAAALEETIERRIISNPDFNAFLDEVETQAEKPREEETAREEVRSEIEERSALFGFTTPVAMAKVKFGKNQEATLFRYEGGKAALVSSGNRVIPLSTKRPLYVGRIKKSDLELQDPAVSGLHAKITLKGEKIFIEDVGTEGKGSLNGTFLWNPRGEDPADEKNWERIPPRQVKEVSMTSFWFQKINEAIRKRNVEIAVRLYVQHRSDLTNPDRRKLKEAIYRIRHLRVMDKMASRALERYDLGKDVQWGSMSPEGQKWTHLWKVHSEKGSFILKLPWYRTKKDLVDWEAGLLEALKEGEVPAAGIVKNKSDENVTVMGGKSWILYEYREGEMLDWGEVEGERLEAAGSVLASIHNVTSQMKDLPGRPYSFEEMPPLIPVTDAEGKLKRLEQIHQELVNRGPPFTIVERYYLDHYAELLIHFNKIRSPEVQALITRTPRAIVHGDYHQGNVRYEDSGISGVFDFEYTRPDARIYDWANTFFIRYQPDGSSLAFDKIKIFLTSYARKIKERVTPIEMELLPYVFRLKYLEVILLHLEKYRKTGSIQTLEEQIMNLRRLDTEDWGGLKREILSIVPEVRSEMRTQAAAKAAAPRGPPQNWLSSGIKTRIKNDSVADELTRENLFEKLPALNRILKKDAALFEGLEERMTDQGLAFHALLERIKNQVMRLRHWGDIDVTMMTLPLVDLNHLSKKYWPGFTDTFKASFHRVLIRHHIDAAFMGGNVLLRNVNPSQAEESIRKWIQESHDEVERTYEHFHRDPAKLRDFRQAFTRLIDNPSSFYASHARFFLKEPPQNSPLPDPSKGMGAVYAATEFGKPRELSREEFEELDEAVRESYLKSIDDFLASRRKSLSEAASFWLNEFYRLRGRGGRRQPLNRARSNASFFIDLLLKDLFERLYERGEVLEKSTGKLKREIDRLMQSQIEGKNRPAPVLSQDLVRKFKGALAEKHLLPEFYEQLQEGRRSALPLYNFRTGRLPRLIHRLDLIRKYSEDLRQILDRLKETASREDFRRFKTLYADYSAMLNEAIELSYRDPRLEEYYKLYWIDEIVKADQGGLLEKWKTHLSARARNTSERKTAERIQPGILAFKRPTGDEIGFVFKIGKEYRQAFAELNKGNAYFQFKRPDERDSVYHRILLGYLRAAENHYNNPPARAPWWGFLKNFNEVIQRETEDVRYPVTEKVEFPEGSRRLPAFVRRGDTTSKIPAYAKDRNKIYKRNPRDPRKWLQTREVSAGDLQPFLTNLSTAVSYSSYPVRPETVAVTFDKMDELTAVQKEDPQLSRKPAGTRKLTQIKNSFARQAGMRSEVRTSHDLPKEFSELFRKAFAERDPKAERVILKEWGANTEGYSFRLDERGIALLFVDTRPGKIAQPAYLNLRDFPNTAVRVRVSRDRNKFLWLQVHMKLGDALIFEAVYDRRNRRLIHGKEHFKERLVQGSGEIPDLTQSIPISRQEQNKSRNHFLLKHNGKTYNLPRPHEARYKGIASDPALATIYALIKEKAGKGDSLYGFLDPEETHTVYAFARWEWSWNSEKNQFSLRNRYFYVPGTSLWFYQLLKGRIASREIYYLRLPVNEKKGTLIYKDLHLRLGDMYRAGGREIPPEVLMVNSMVENQRVDLYEPVRSDGERGRFDPRRHYFIGSKFYNPRTHLFERGWQEISRRHQEWLTQEVSGTPPRPVILRTLVGGGELRQGGHPTRLLLDPSGKPVYFQQQGFEDRLVMVRFAEFMQKGNLRRGLEVILLGEDFTPEMRLKRGFYDAGQERFKWFSVKNKQLHAKVREPLSEEILSLGFLSFYLDREIRKIQNRLDEFSVSAANELKTDKPNFNKLVHDRNLLLDSMDAILEKIRRQGWDTESLDQIHKILMSVMRPVYEAMRFEASALKSRYPAGTPVVFRERKGIIDSYGTTDAGAVVTIQFEDLLNKPNPEDRLETYDLLSVQDELTVKKFPRSEVRAQTFKIGKDPFPLMVDVFNPPETRAELLVNPAPSGHFTFDHVNRKAFWEGQEIEAAFSDDRINHPWERHESALGVPRPDQTSIVYSYHNLYWNDWFTAYDGERQELYHHRDEPFDQRPYSMLIHWKDGHYSIETLRFAQRTGDPKKKYLVYREKDPGRSDLSDQIKFSIFGQQLIEKGEKVDLARIAAQFQDLFHLYQFPQTLETLPDGKMTYGEAIGPAEMAQGDAHPLTPDGRPVLKKALEEDGYEEIDLSPYLPRYQSIENIKNKILNQALLNKRRYQETGARPPAELSEGRYFIDDNNILHIRFYKFPYPHNLIGVTESGKPVGIVVTGDKTQGIGYPVQDIADKIRDIEKEIGETVVDLLLLANSRDAFRRVDGKFAQKSGPEAYETSPAALAFIIPRIIILAGIHVNRFVAHPDAPFVLIPEAIDDRALEILKNSGKINFDVLDPGPEAKRISNDEILRIGEAKKKEGKGYEAVLGFVNHQLAKSEEFFRAFPDLKMIALFSRGYNAVDVDLASRHQVPVTNIGDMLTQAMAELNIGMMLEAHFRLLETVDAEPGEGRISLESMNLDPGRLAEILWAELLSKVLRLREMYEFGRSPRFSGAGVAEQDTILHDQLAKNEYAGIEPAVGFVGNQLNRPLLERLARIAAAHEVAALYYHVPKNGRLSESEEKTLGLQYFASPEELRQKSRYLIRLDASDLFARPEDKEILNRPVEGKVLGLQSFGNISQAVARRALGLGMKVNALLRNPKEEMLGVTFYPLSEPGEVDQFLKEAEILTLLAPPGPQSTNFLNRENLSKLSRLEVFINTGRGDLVDEDALAAYLAQNPGKIQVRLDVLKKESGFSEQPLFRHPEVQVSGHTGSAVRDIRLAMQRYAIEENLLPFFEGRPPKNPIVPRAEVRAEKKLEIVKVESGEKVSRLSGREDDENGKRQRVKRQPRVIQESTESLWDALSYSSSFGPFKAQQPNKVPAYIVHPQINKGNWSLPSRNEPIISPARKTVPAWVKNDSNVFLRSSVNSNMTNKITQPGMPVNNNINILDDEKLYTKITRSEVRTKISEVRSVSGRSPMELQRRAYTLSFDRTIELLAKLKEGNPEEREQALKELVTWQTERFGQLRRKDPEAYLYNRVNAPVEIIIGHLDHTEFATRRAEIVRLLLNLPVPILLLSVRNLILHRKNPKLARKILRNILYRSFVDSPEISRSLRVGLERLQKAGQIGGRELTPENKTLVAEELKMLDLLSQSKLPPGSSTQIRAEVRSARENFDEIFAAFVAPPSLTEAVQKARADQVMTTAQKNLVYQETRRLFKESGLEEILKNSGVNKYVLYPVSGTAPGRVAVPGHSDLDLALAVQTDFPENFNKLVDAMKNVRGMNFDHILDLGAFYKLARFFAPESLSRLGVEHSIDVFIKPLGPVGNFYIPDDSFIETLYEMKMPVEVLLSDADFNAGTQAQIFSKTLSSRFERTARFLRDEWHQRLSVDYYHLMDIAGMRMESFRSSKLPMSLGVVAKTLQSLLASHAGGWEEFKQDLTSFQRQSVPTDRFSARVRSREDIAHRELGNFSKIGMRALDSNSRINERNLTAAFAYYETLKQTTNPIGRLIRDFQSGEPFESLAGHPIYYLFTAPPETIENEFGAARELVVLGLLIDLISRAEVRSARLAPSAPQSLAGQPRAEARSVSGRSPMEVQRRAYTLSFDRTVELLDQLKQGNSEEQERALKALVAWQTERYEQVLRKDPAAYLYNRIDAPVEIIIGHLDHHKFVPRQEAIVRLVLNLPVPVLIQSVHYLIMNSKNPALARKILRKALYRSFLESAGKINSLRMNLERINQTGSIGSRGLTPERKALVAEELKMLNIISQSNLPPASTQIRAEVRSMVEERKIQTPVLDSRRERRLVTSGRITRTESSTTVNRSSIPVNLPSTRSSRSEIPTTPSAVTDKSLRKDSISVPTSVTVKPSFLSRSLAMDFSPQDDTFRTLSLEPPYVNIKNNNIINSEKQISSSVRLVFNWTQTLPLRFEVLGRDFMEQALGFLGVPVAHAQTEESIKSQSLADLVNSPAMIERIQKKRGTWSISGTARDANFYVVTSRLAIGEGALPFLRALVGEKSAVVVLVQDENEKTLIEKFNKEILINRPGVEVLLPEDWQKIKNRQDLMNWWNSKIGKAGEELRFKGFQSLAEPSEISEKLREVLDDVDTATAKMFEALGIADLVRKFNEFKAQFALQTAA